MLRWQRWGTGRLSALTSGHFSPHKASDQLGCQSFGASGSCRNAQEPSLWGRALLYFKHSHCQCKDSLSVHWGSNYIRQDSKTTRHCGRCQASLPLLHLCMVGTKLTWTGQGSKFGWITMGRVGVCILSRCITLSHITQLSTTPSRRFFPYDLEKLRFSPDWFDDSGKQGTLSSRVLIIFLPMYKQ